MTDRTTSTAFYAAALAEYNTADLTKKQLRALAAKLDVFLPAVVWKNRVGKGLFRIPAVDAKPAKVKAKAMMPAKIVKVSTKKAVPEPALPVPRKTAATAEVKSVGVAPKRKAAVTHVPYVAPVQDNWVLQD